jgi:hypothetical protein
MPSSYNHENYPLILVAAAAAAASATLVWYRRPSRNSQTPSPDYKIPAALLQSAYAEELKLAVQLALQGKYLDDIR